MGKQGKRARARYKTRRSEKRRAEFAYGKGFFDGFVAAKDKFVVGDGLLSMTITRHWAALKNARGTV